VRLVLTWFPNPPQQLVGPLSYVPPPRHPHTQFSPLGTRASQLQLGFGMLLVDQNPTPPPRVSRRASALLGCRALPGASPAAALRQPHLRTTGVDDWMMTCLFAVCVVGRRRSTIVDPYLNLFRGIIPPIGGTLDLSPILAFVVLNVFTGCASHYPSFTPASLLVDDGRPYKFQGSVVYSWTSSGAALCNAQR